MKAGIMQPYFFPYIGYFQLIYATDIWVVFDSAQYMRHGWVNRNRILHPSAGPKYVVLPLKSHSVTTRICDIELHPSHPWRERILAQLTGYYRKQAPFFNDVYLMVSAALRADEQYLTPLLVNCLKACCNYLDIEFNPILSSNLDIQASSIEHGGQWALQIARRIGASAYVNPITGQALFDSTEFRRANVELAFLSPSPPKYDQGGGAYHENLSILDVLMWNSREAARAQLEHYSMHRDRG